MTHRLLSVEHPYRPARRVSPRRSLWRHGIVADVLITAILTAGVTCAVWWLLP